MKATESTNSLYFTPHKALSCLMLLHRQDATLQVSFECLGFRVYRQDATLQVSFECLGFRVYSQDATLQVSFECLGFRVYRMPLYRSALNVVMIMTIVITVVVAV
jgi:hypothetical protein